MNARDILNRAVLRVANKDIRLVGQWQPLWCLSHSSAAIADEIGINADALSRCQDIAAIVDLIKKERICHREYLPHQTTLEFF